MEDKHDDFCPYKGMGNFEDCKYCDVIDRVRKASSSPTDRQLHDSWMQGYEKGYANAMRDVKISMSGVRTSRGR